MKKTIILFITILMLFGVSYSHEGHSPEDGQQHICFEDNDIIIIYNAKKLKWFWYLDSGIYNISGLPTIQVEVKICPKCGCKPNRTYCEE